MIFDLFRLDGKVALVTGATRGIGLGIVEALSDAGAHIILSSRVPKPDVVQRFKDPTIVLACRDAGSGARSSIATANTTEAQGSATMGRAKPRTWRMTAIISRSISRCLR